MHTVTVSAVILMSMAIPVTSEDKDQRNNCKTGCITHVYSGAMRNQWMLKFDKQKQDLYKHVDQMIRKYGSNAILHANSTEVAKLLIGSGADVNYKDPTTKATLLHNAVKTGNLELVQWLHDDRVADFAYKDKNGNTVLDIAIHNRHGLIVQYLVRDCGFVLENSTEVSENSALDNAAILDNTDEVQYLCSVASSKVLSNLVRPLQLAVLFNNTETVGWLIQNVNLSDKDLGVAMFSSVDNLSMLQMITNKTSEGLNCKDVNGSTLLHAAAKQGNMETLMYLLQHDLDVNAVNTAGNTPLHLATQQNQIQVVEYLVLNAGADVNISNNDGNTALHFVVQFCDLSILKMLLKYAENPVGARNKDNMTALQCSVLYNKPHMTRYLLQFPGRDVTKQDGTNALFLAVEHRDWTYVRLIHKNVDVDINAKDKDGNTALLLAVMHGKFATVKYLIEECHADVNVSNKEGNTAVLLAIMYFDRHILNYLKHEAKADMSAVNLQGDSALHLAATNVEAARMVWDGCKKTMFAIKNNEGRNPYDIIGESVWYGSLEKLARYAQCEE